MQDRHFGSTFTLCILSYIFTKEFWKTEDNHVAVIQKIRNVFLFAKDMGRLRSYTKDEVYVKVFIKYCYKSKEKHKTEDNFL